MLKSRLKSKNKSKKIIYKFGLGLLIVFLIYKFAVPTIIQLSLLFENNKEDFSNQNEDPNISAPPILLDTFTATNSSIINLEGYTQDRQTVVIFVNNQGLDEITTDSDGGFIFEEVPLDIGDNILYSKVKVDDKFSQKSNIIKVFYSNKKPEINLDGISDGMQVDKNQSDINIKGTVENTDSLTINNSWVAIKPDRTFEKTMYLDGGSNNIIFNAENNSGNNKILEIKIIRQD